MRAADCHNCRVSYTIALAPKIQGDRVRARREALNLSQVELAKLLGIDQSVLSKLENGHRVAKGAAMQEGLAGALKTSLAYLRGQTDNPDPAVKLPIAPEMAAAIREFLGEDYFPDGILTSRPRTQRPVIQRVVRDDLPGNLLPAEPAPPRLYTPTESARMAAIVRAVAGSYQPDRHALGDALVVVQALGRLAAGEDGAARLLDMAAKLRAAGIDPTPNQLIAAGFQK